MKDILNKNDSIEEFDGLTLNQLNILLTDISDVDSPIKFSFEEKTIIQIPLIKQVEYFISILENEKQVKLTTKGYLPPAIVKDIYSKKYLTDDGIEHNIIKLTKEIDSNSIVLTKIICELSGLTKKRNNVLSLTQKGQNAKDKVELFKLIFKTFCITFNWSYFDAYESEKNGQFGHTFSLYLISKYGNDLKKDTFYSEKYFKAFPFMKQQSLDFDFNDSCYSIRTFDRFMDYFGLIEITEKSYKEKYIRKSKLFDEIICTALNSA